MQKLDRQILSDFSKLTVIFLYLILFKYIDVLLKNIGFRGYGYFEVVIFWLVTTWLIYTQMRAFREIAKKWMLRNVLNKNHWFTGFLENRTIFLSVTAFIVSFIISPFLLSFIYTANEYILILLFVDIFIFYFLETKIKYNFKRAFNPDFAKLMSEFAPVLINILVLCLLFIVISIWDKSNVFAVGSIEIPQTVGMEVNHSCKFFKWFVITNYLIELHIKSLRTIPDAGWYIYLIIIFATTSLVPFSGTSMIYKTVLKFRLPKFSKKTPVKE